MAVEIRGVQRTELLLTDAERNHRRRLGRNPGSAQPLIEGQVGVAHHGAEDQVWVGLLDAIDRSRHVAATEENVFLAHQFCAERLDLVLHDGVDAVRPDIVGPDEENTMAQIVDAPLNGGSDLLIRSGTRVNDVRRLLQALVRHGIDEQMRQPFENRLNRLAAGRRPATENGHDFFLGNQPLGFRGKCGPVGLAVCDYRLNGSSQQTTVLVDLFNRQLLSVHH